MQIELRAKSCHVGCLSTVIVFMLAPACTSTRPAPSRTGYPDTLSAGDAPGGSARHTMAQKTTDEAVSASTGHVAHVIRNVKVHFEDSQFVGLRPTTPFKRPPRVSGKQATIQIDGLPLERQVDVFF